MAEPTLSLRELERLEALAADRRPLDADEAGQLCAEVRRLWVVEQHARQLMDALDYLRFTFDEHPADE